MPGSASVEFRRQTRRPSRADSRSDDGRGWRQTFLSLTWLLCCIKTTSDDVGQQAEHDSDLGSGTSPIKTSEVHEVCGENDHIDSNNNDEGENTNNILTDQIYIPF